METTTKLAIGVSALCCLVTTAFAGGPEVPMIDMNGINIGLGAAYQSYKYNTTQTDFTGGNTVLSIGNSLNSFGPVGELGYTYAGDTWIFGILAQYEYDDLRNYATVIGTNGQTNGYAQVKLQSHLNAMLLAGLKVNDANVVYLEGGYSALWARPTVSLGATPGATNTPTTTTKVTLNGGIAGIGWRHYFMSNVFLDVAYNFAIYADSNVNTTVLANGTTAQQQLNGIARTTVNGVTATANYLFNV